MERKFRLADFIRLNWDKYAEHPTEPIRPEQYKAVNAIRVCRTAALGVDTYVCPECGEVSEIYLQLEGYHAVGRKGKETDA